MKEDITMEKSRTNQQLKTEPKETQLRLEEAEETLRLLQQIAEADADE